MSLMLIKIAVVERPCDARIGNVGPKESIDWFEFQDGDNYIRICLHIQKGLDTNK